MTAAQAHIDDEEVARAACAALANLANPADTKVPLVHKHAHLAVMAAARAYAGNVEVVRAACITLWNLACVADNATGRKPQ